MSRSACPKPNLLVLMADQLQAAVLDPKHPCITPNMDRLAGDGVRFDRAYTPNAVCSPARASLMTGLLPHNHGVLHVTHTVDDDQSCLRAEKPHWAQRLRKNGYNTGYFGKWHVERTNDLDAFGWTVNGECSQPLYRARQEQLNASSSAEAFSLARRLKQPDGYDERTLLYGVTATPPERRGVGVATSLALDFLSEQIGSGEPWCCFVSVLEPHDPFICGEEAFALYDVDQLELPPSAADPMLDKPGLYRRSARAYRELTERERKEALACYYASVTELDGQFGRLLQYLRDRNAMENTIVIVTSDHGELLGAHGLYCKNIGAFEEVYRIPLLAAGPGVERGAVSKARVGLHDLCPTILELTGSEAINAPDSASFVRTLSDPTRTEQFRSGYAEYHGGRFLLTQRIVWDGDWKLVFNGFDEDELYDLGNDPYEWVNLIQNPKYADKLRHLYEKLWINIAETGDHSLLNSDYPPLRLGRYGPRSASERR